MDGAVRGENEQAGVVHVDEGHHDEFVRSLGVGRRSSGAGFVAKVQRGFVAVMSVGDDEFLVTHLALHRGDDSGIGNLPDAVSDAVFVDDIDGGRGRLGGVEGGIDLPGVFIEKEELLVVDTGGAEQVEAVGLGLGQGLLVAVDDLGSVVLNTAARDETPAFQTGSGGCGEGLGIRVDGGSGILLEDALGAPVAAGGGSARIYIVSGIVGGIAAAEDDADKVVRAGRVIAVLHGGRDLVGGVSDNIRSGN